MTRGTLRTVASSLLAGLVVAIAFPLAELWLDCNPPRSPRSEACVWGHSLLPVSLVVGSVLGLGLGIFIFGVRRALRKQP
jgi:hypothetical protein